MSSVIPDVLYVKMEFSVQLTGKKSEEEIRMVLRGKEGIRSVQVDVKNELVIIETNLPVVEVQELLRETGHIVLFRAFGGTISNDDLSSAAVAIINTDNVKGLIRFLQVDDNYCILDGTVDGLQPGISYFVRVRCFGDLSQGSESCGDVYNTGTGIENEGELGTVYASTNGRVQFRFSSQKLNVSDIIGRSLAIDSNKGNMACAVIARAAGLFENRKRFCTCDGVSQWDEAQKLT